RLVLVRQLERERARAGPALYRAHAFERGCIEVTRLVDAPGDRAAERTDLFGRVRAAGGRRTSSLADLGGNSGPGQGSPEGVEQEAVEDSHGSLVWSRSKNEASAVSAFSRTNKRHPWCPARPERGTRSVRLQPDRNEASVVSGFS